MPLDKSAEPWLLLSLCPELSHTTALKLISHFGTATDALGVSASDWRAAGLSAAAISFLRAPDESILQPVTDWLAGNGRWLIGQDHPGFPPLLIESGEAPLCLYGAGDRGLLTLPQLAIVGSRNATPGGRETAQEFAAHLASAGLVITSGLAEGIDTAAHEGALQGGGSTVAVLGTGPDRVYPRSNIALAGRIATNGTIITEFPPGMDARRDHFPRRNRIISGLSLGVLVVEAGLRSGSLITARYAANYGREIFAVPGSIHNPLSKGCHRLIKQGAKLIETAADIADEIGSLAGALAETTAHVATQSDTGASSHADPDYAKLLNSMGYDPVSVNQLAARSGLTAEQLSSMLLILELEGRVNSLSGGHFQQHRV